MRLTTLTALPEVNMFPAPQAVLGPNRAEQEKLVEALSESVRLSNLRYRGGLDSYLQVLDAERNLFGGQLTRAQLRLEDLQSVVQL